MRISGSAMQNNPGSSQVVGARVWISRVRTVEPHRMQDPPSPGEPLTAACWEADTNTTAYPRQLSHVSLSPKSKTCRWTHQAVRRVHSSDTASLSLFGDDPIVYKRCQSDFDHHVNPLQNDEPDLKPTWRHCATSLLWQADGRDCPSVSLLH